MLYFSFLNFSFNSGFFSSISLAPLKFLGKVRQNSLYKLNFLKLLFFLIEFLKRFGMVSSCSFSNPLKFFLATLYIFSFILVFILWRAFIFLYLPSLSLIFFLVPLRGRPFLLVIKRGLFLEVLLKFSGSFWISFNSFNKLLVTSAVFLWVIFSENSTLFFLPTSSFWVTLLAFLWLLSRN